jgi:hypothetical protein
MAKPYDYTEFLLFFFLQAEVPKMFYAVYYNYTLLEFRLVFFELLRRLFNIFRNDSPCDHVH